MEPRSVETFVVGMYFVNDFYLCKIHRRVVQYCSKHTDGYFCEIIPTDGGPQEGYVQRLFGEAIKIDLVK